MSGEHRGFESADIVLTRAQVAARSAGRASIGEDDIGMVLIDACGSLVRRMGVEPEAWRDLTLKYLAAPHPLAATGNDLDLTAVALLEAAQQEASRAGHGEVDATHLLVALLREDGSTVAANGRHLGLTAARVREELGLPAYRRPFADGFDVSDRVRPASCCCVLLGGGRLTDSLPRALDTIGSIRRRPITELRVAVIGATNRWGGSATTQRLRRLGVAAFDTAINDRAAAHAANLAVLDVDCVYVAGGDPARGADVLLGTPAAAGLAQLAARGVVMAGMSAGATIWGAATLSAYVNEGDPEPVPMLGFLPNTIVVAHHLPNSPRLPNAQRAFKQHRIIAIGHEAAVRIDDDVVTEVAPGEAPSVVL